MNVKELIRILRNCSQDAGVSLIIDPIMLDLLKIANEKSKVHEYDLNVNVWDSIDGDTDHVELRIQPKYSS